MLFRFIVLLISFFCFIAPAAAEDPPHHSTARIFSSVEGVGHLKTIPVGVAIDLEKNWKTYWRTPGEAGLAPVFSWIGSKNFKEAKISWPAPMRYSAFGIDNFGYEKNITFPIDVTPKKIGEPVSLVLRMDLLVCEKICVPETHRLSIQIPAKEAIVSADQAILAEAVKKIPETGNPEAFTVEDIWLQETESKDLFLHINATAAKAFSGDTDMFVEPARTYMITSKPEMDYNSFTDRLRIKTMLRSPLPLDMLKEQLADGKMTVTLVDGGRSFERPVTLTNIKKHVAAAPEPQKAPMPEGSSILSILLMAFLGGLILNLMPCVLPVLSIKILSVLSHGGKDHRIHHWTIFTNFMASAMGIIFSFWLMAGALVLLKTAGHSIGWGIQFQHPGFLIFLIIVLLGFAANMWGLFEIPLPRFIAKHLAKKHEHEPTLLGHFLTGAFATLLATPCTAPFLGTAVGFALARDAYEIFLVFTMLGIGLAYPYMVLALVPHVFKYMPKPGRWMVTLKKILAVALAFTAAWLINVLITISTQATLDEGWTPFSEALIKPAVDEGRTVVVDVTADWCLTCKANKRLVLEQKDVMEALSEPNILRLQADWTHRDEAIALYLRKYGRYGIPFNIIYGPGAPNGIILSELLSKEIVMRALAEAAAE